MRLRPAPRSSRSRLPASAQDDSSGETTILRIGWAQDPTTINPFVGLDEEAYNIWALNWDLLVNFSPDDLSPAPGIAESWDVSEDEQDRSRSTSTPTRIGPTASRSPRRTSSGRSRPSAKRAQLFTDYTSGITSIETPDDKTVVVKTRRPDARIIGGIFVYILPEHIWGKVPLKELTGSYKPELPLVGSGPYIVTEYERGRIVKMERNPEFRGDAPAFDEVQYIKYGTQDAVERALQLGEVDMVMEVSDEQLRAPRLGAEHRDGEQRLAGLHRARLQPLPRGVLPGREVQPGGPGRRGAPGDRLRDRSRAHQRDRRPQHLIHRPTGSCPEFYKSFYEIPEQDYPLDVEPGQPDPRRRRLGDGRRRRAREGRRAARVRPLRALGVAVQHQAAKLVAEQTAPIGVKFNVQVVSVGKLTDLTVRFVDGKPAPDFDTFIWGWGGDPYDPSFLLSLFLTKEIGGLSDSFYSNPEYDRLFDEQAGSFDTEERKAIIQKMVAITQRDVPVRRAHLRRRTCRPTGPTRVENVSRACPADDTGDIICEQVGYEPLLSITPGDASGSSEGGGQSPGLAVVAAIVFGFGGWFIGARQSRRREREPLEIAE